MTNKKSRLKVSEIFLFYSVSEELLPEELSNQQGQLPLKGVKVVILRNSDQKEVASIIVDRFSYEENNP